jgi:hypothetical protein
MHGVAWMDILKVGVPLAISLVTLWIVLKDRRPRLVLKNKEGNWFSTKKCSMGTLVQGVFDVYNLSNRANSIRNYEFWWREEDDKFTKLSRHRNIDGANYIEDGYNVTPLVLAPYSGSEVRVQALALGIERELYAMVVRIIVEDLFGKKYDLYVCSRITESPLVMDSQSPRWGTDAQDNRD